MLHLFLHQVITFASKHRKMIREIVNINEELCDGCGLCVPNCHEGALQIIDEKARLISDLMCDGLGACIGHCPQGAITIEKREAQPYDEVAVIEEMVKKGKNTVLAHLKHLKDHNETDFLKQGVGFLKQNKDKIDFDVDMIISEVHNSGNKIQIKEMEHKHEHVNHGGCPGSRAMVFEIDDNEAGNSTQQPSALSHWPVQMHLINPASGHFKGSDFLLAADCVAFTLGNFHSKLLKNKTIGIACPKLDEGADIYIQKLTSLIDDAKINTLTVTIMEVPCCGGLLQMARIAADNASRKVPVKCIVVGTQGNILREDWV